MESQPRNPEFRNNPENFHPCLNIKCNRVQKALKYLKVCAYQGISS